jgi:hypothetical protein
MKTGNLGEAGILETLQVDLKERSYPIKFGAGNLKYLGEAMAALRPLQQVKRVFVITDERVGPLYGDIVLESLKQTDFEPFYYQLPDGEEYKTLESANKLYTAAIEKGLDRQSAVVALQLEKKNTNLEISRSVTLDRHNHQQQVLSPILIHSHHNFRPVLSVYGSSYLTRFYNITGTA